jgi:hypothetical protein
VIRGAHKVWEPELVEHVAFYAAQGSDTELEQLCDEVLAGITEEEVLFSLIREDPNLSDWCAPDQRYRRRTTEVNDKLTAEAA